MRAALLFLRRPSEVRYSCRADEPIRRGPTLRSTRELLVTAWDSVRDRIHDVVQSDADSQSRKLLVIAGIVSKLPGIAQIGVERQSGDQASSFVIDAAPLGRAAFT